MQKAIAIVLVSQLVAGYGIPKATSLNTPKVVIKDDILDLLVKGEDPTYACNAKLKRDNPERFKELEALPTVAPQIDPLTLAGINTTTPPVMENASLCVNSHKNSCMDLLSKALTNPKQMAFGAVCSDDVVEEYQNLEKDPPTPPKSIWGGIKTYYNLDRQRKLKEITDGFEEAMLSLKKGEICENQLEMTQEIVSALDGNPNSKLREVDPERLMEMLKDINPSAYEAISCLTESNGLDSNPIPLGGKKGVRGELTGTLTGIQYSEGFNKFGFDETGIIAAFGAACLAGPVFCVFGIAGGTVTAGLTAWQIHSTNKNAEEANQRAREADQRARETNEINRQAADRAHQLNEWDKGFETELYGTKEGCDGKGNCNLIESNPADNPQEDSRNPEDSSATKDPEDTNITIRIEDNIGPDTNNDPIENPIYHFPEGTEEEVCKNIYEDQRLKSIESIVGGINRQIDGKIEKFATFSKEYYEELGKTNNPIDFTSDEFKNRDRFNNDASCKVMTLEEGA